MSGAMGQPGMPPGMGQQPQMPQGLPPQILAQLQRGGGQQGAAPQGQPGGMVPQMPTGAPAPQQMGGPGLTAQPFGGIGSAAAQNPNLAMFARAAQGGPGGPLPPLGQQQGPGGQSRLTPAEMARLGRFGDQTVAHLTPGEIQVPPELQSPKVLATLDTAFKKAGVSPQQFVAGSPQSSHNPATGAPEYSLWAALLPVAGAVAGSFLLPGLGTAGGAALGGALGGAAGGLVDHTGALGVLGGAAGGAAGGFAGGGGLSGLFGGAADAAGAAGAGAADAGAGAVTNAATSAPFGVGASGISPAVDTALGNAANASGETWQSGIGAIPKPTDWTQIFKAGMGAGMGAGLGSSLAPQPVTSPPFTPGLQNAAMHPINQSFNKLLGNNQTSRVQTGGFNPFTSVSGQPFSFYPQLPPGQ